MTEGLVWGQMIGEQLEKEGVIDPQDIRFYLHLCNGETETIGPATGLRLTTDELVFLLGDLVMARVPRKRVYFVTRQEIAVPILF
jgi:hypothetical protein